MKHYTLKIPFLTAPVAINQVYQVRRLYGVETLAVQFALQPEARQVSSLLFLGQQIEKVRGLFFCARSGALYFQKRDLSWRSQFLNNFGLTTLFIETFRLLDLISFVEPHFLTFKT
jgi:hypothetical protein